MKLPLKSVLHNGLAGIYHYTYMDINGKMHEGEHIMYMGKNKPPKEIIKLFSQTKSIFIVTDII